MMICMYCIATISNTTTSCLAMQSAREAATLLLRTQMLLSVASQAAALVPSLHSPGHHLLGKSPLRTRYLGHCCQN